LPAAGFGTFLPARHSLRHQALAGGEKVPKNPGVALSPTTEHLSISKSIRMNAMYL